MTQELNVLLPYILCGKAIERLSLISTSSDMFNFCVMWEHLKGAFFILKLYN